MADRKKILVLTPRFPYPQLGGDKLRIFQLCKMLSIEYDLILLSLCDTVEQLNFIIPNDGVFTEVHRVYLPKYRSYFNCVLGLFSARPLQVSYYFSKVFASLFCKLSIVCDVILVHLVRMAHYVALSEKPKILEMTDAISLNYSRLPASYRFNFMTLVYRFECKRLNCYERSIVYDFDLNILVSDVDRDFLFKNNEEILKKNLICNLPVDLNYVYKPYVSGVFSIVFLGNMRSEQNLNAVFWFVEHVLPLLNLGLLCQFVFKVIGDISVKNANLLNSIDFVEVKGFISDVSFELKTASLGVCPVFSGAGVQTKILSYMSAGLPVVTTSIGAEGFLTSENDIFLVANSEAEFVDAILNLASSFSFAESLSKNGYAYVEKYHSWPLLSARLLSRVIEVL